MSAQATIRIGLACAPELEAKLARWGNWQRAQNITRRTIHERSQLIRRWAVNLSIDPVTAGPEEVVDHLASLSSPATRQANFYILRAWFKWLLMTGHRDDNPMAFVGTPKCPRRRPRPMATAHLERLLNIRLKRRTRTMILLAAYQGLRVHEVAKMRGEDVDLLAGRLRVVGKGSVDVTLPLHPIIAEEALRYPRRGFWFPSYIGTHEGKAGSTPVLPRSVSTVIGDAMRRAEVPGTPHSLRHWFGTELVRSGANLREAQELLRHASLQTTALYTDVADEERAAAILRLPTVRYRSS